MVKPLLSAQALGHAQADKRLEILHLIGQHGSISQAARAAGVSYKAAWQAIQTLTNLAGEPLVDSSVGGRGGGGARLTASGTRLLEAASMMEQARRQVLARVNDEGAGALAGPRTSMRNTLRGVVSRLESAAPREPMLRVVLRVLGTDGRPGDDELASRITRDSAQLLDLQPGLPLLVLCKAAAVRVTGATQDGGGPAAAGARQSSAINRLPARVMRLSRGQSCDEAVLTLRGGQQLVGFADAPNRLRQGSRALAQIDEAALVLALT